MSVKLMLPLRSPSTAFIIILLAVSPFNLIVCEEHSEDLELSGHGVTAPLIFPSNDNEDIGHLTPMEDEHITARDEKSVTAQEKIDKASQPGAVEKVPDGFKVNVTWREEKPSNGAEPASPKESPSNSTDKEGGLAPTGIPNSTTSEGKYGARGADDHWLHDHPAPRAGPLHYGRSPEATAIIAGLFVGVAIFGYLALVCWRRSLEKRYGNRELLVNDDEVVETDDLRNYTL